VGERSYALLTWAHTVGRGLAGRRRPRLAVPQRAPYGSGDEYSIAFTEAGAYVRGFDQSPDVGMADIETTWRRPATRFTVG
jgi:hypothetical protein